MLEHSPTIGVIVVSYNTAELLRACLHSLEGCRLPLKIVVVDNASRDGSAALVQAEFPTVDLIALERNSGYAGGTNIGLGELLAEPPPYVLVLNPDTVVHTGAIEAMVSFLDAHQRVGLVGPRLLNPDGSRQPAAFRFPTLAMLALDLFPPGEVLPGRLYNSWWHGRYPQEGGATPFPIDHPLGACMLIRSAALADVGGMDEGYFMYSEEIDWCWRIRAAGWAIWQVPAAQVTHVGGAATQQVRWRMLVALYSSRRRFSGRYRSRWFQRAEAALIGAGMLRAILRSWYAYSRGAIAQGELRGRLLAYAEVLRSARGPGAGG